MSKFAHYATPVCMDLLPVKTAVVLVGVPHEEGEDHENLLLRDQLFRVFQGTGLVILVSAEVEGSKDESFEQKKNTQVG